ncbi:MAG: branched-chain amino acid ABC transporter permease [Candidatus Dormibacteraceae bacterium]
MNLAIFAVGLILASLAARTRSPRVIRRAAIASLFGLLLAAPLLGDTTAVLFDAFTAMCIAYGWNVIGGYAGYAAFGNVAYLGLGAFVAAGFMSRQPGHLGLPWFIGIPLAVGIVSLVALAIGLAVLRLRGHYFSIATLGVSIAMPELINWDLLFGPRGLIPNFFGAGQPLNFPLVDDLVIAGQHLEADRHLFYYLGLLTALIGLSITVLLSRSKLGYALVAIRENEEAAESMGVNTTVVKSIAYVVSASLAALGGSVLGFKLTNMTTEADALFSTTNNLQMIIITLVGGAGTIWGPWLGAFILFGLQETLRALSSGEAFLQWQAVIFSAVIIGVVLFLPRGLMRFLRGHERFSWRVVLGQITANRE